MTQSNHDAQHPATATRMLQATRDGDVAKSQELASAIHLVCALGLVYLTIQSTGKHFVGFTAKLWADSSIAATTVEDFNSKISTAAMEAGFLVLPLLLAIGLISVLSHLIQNPAAASNRQGIFRSDSLNPIRGIQRLLSAENLFRSVLGVPKIALISIVFCMTIWSMRSQFANLSFQAADGMLVNMVDCIFIPLMTCTSTILLTSLADYLMERFATAKRLRMSDQELRDENRLQQVDPQISSRRQQLYQELLNQ